MEADDFLCSNSLPFALPCPFLPFFPSFTFSAFLSGKIHAWLFHGLLTPFTEQTMQDNAFFPLNVTDDLTSKFAP